MEVTIDKDPSLNYETKGFFKKSINLLIIFFLNLLPVKIGAFLLKKPTEQGKIIKEKATTFHALDILYVTNGLYLKQGILKGFINYFWFQLDNPRAVRNRLRLVKKTLNILINKRRKIKNNKISIFSLGSGSARAIIETAIKNTSLHLSINLLDKDPAALNFSKKLISEYKPKNCSFNFILDKVRNCDKYFKQEKPDIVEMVGILDYLNDEKAIKVFKKIYNNLSKDCFFITANIRKNREAKFITKTIGWPMVYRKSKNLKKILFDSGFKKDKIRIVLEPLKIHMVAICQK